MAANYNLRNSQLLSRVQAHPLKKTLARALDIAEVLRGDVEFLALDRNLSDTGRQNAMQSKLRAAIRDLRDARAPLVEMEKKLDAKRKAVAMPAFDQSDSVGFLRRQELRQVLRSMDAGQRSLHLADPAFCDALLELPPIASGFFVAENFTGTISPEIQRDRDIVAAAKENRLAGMFGPQLAEIDGLEQTLAEANMIADVARVDLQNSSGMEPAQFNEFCKPVESKANAPWLRKFVEDGREVIRVIVPGEHSARLATEREVLDGKYYTDFSEYQADRAAA
jgi:hypothetical protein